MKISEFKKRFLKDKTKFTISGYGGFLSKDIPFEVKYFSDSYYSITRLTQVSNIKKITNKYVYFYSTDIFSNIVENKVPISCINLIEPTEQEIVEEKMNRLKNLK